MTKRKKNLFSDAKMAWQESSFVELSGYFREES